MDKLYIIKAGGNVLDDEELKDGLLNLVALNKGKKILVHGGGKIATKIGSSLGIKANMVEGRRVTDTETLDLVTMVYGGLINKKLVAGLQARNCRAIGLTGADGNLILSDKRPPLNGVDYGMVGEPKAIHAELVQSIFQQNDVLVVAPLTHDGKGNMLNTNADTVASGLAEGLTSLFEVELIYCFELKGVLADIQQPDSVIKDIKRENFDQLKKEGVVADGMIPKLEGALKSVDNGVRKVMIMHVSDLSNYLRTGNCKGTTIA